ncbi:MAG: CPBP family intramembrane metalloprotease [Coriobacteriia bacterium]|nr:CPBP family intramembrane metalloprotease [Coriobacteriia bacterium]
MRTGKIRTGKIRTGMDTAAKYKTSVRHEVTRISLAILAFYAVYLIVCVAFMAVLMFTSGFLSDLREANDVTSALLMSEFLANLPLGWLSIVTLFCGMFTMLIVRGKRLFTTDLTKTSKRIRLADLAMMAGLILGINAVVTLGQTLLMFVSESFGIDSSGMDESFITGLMDLPGMLYVVLLGPIIEEIIFRGAILRALERFGQNFALVVSSLAFGLYHLMLFQGIFAFFVGLVLGYCALHYSIKWAMLLHVINNGYAMGLTALGAGVQFEVGIIIVMLGLGLLALAFAHKQLKRQVATGKPAEMHHAVGLPLGFVYALAPDQRSYQVVASGEPLKGKPYQAAFSTPWLIVVLILAALVIVGTSIML